MVIVAICDDGIKTGAELERALIGIFGRLDIEHEIDVFFTGDELCRKMEEGAHYDLIFLDLDFTRGEISGAEARRLISGARQDNMASIVYISREKNFDLRLFELQPLIFLLKPLEYGKIEKVVRMYLGIAGLWSGEFTYKRGHDTFKARVKDIVYLESKDRKLILHLSGGGAEEFYGSLKEAYREQLQRFDFLFIHKSYVVNYDYVAALKSGQVLLADFKTPLPVSKHRRNDVKERYSAIMSRRAV